MRPIPGKSSFFHTLVIVGGSIVGCGGKAQDGSRGPSGDGDASGSGSSGSGAEAGDGDIQVGSGGSISVGSGGAIGLGTGGASPGAGGAHMGGAHGLDCPPEHWACTNLGYDCSWQVDELRGDCICDENKPLGQDDCEPGTAFTCMGGVEYDGNWNVAATQPFDCACLPQAETCDEQCEPLVNHPSECSEPGTIEYFEGYLCGCELALIR